MPLPKSTSLSTFLVASILTGLGSVLVTAFPASSQSPTVNDRSPLVAFRCGRVDPIRLSVAPSRSRARSEPVVVNSANLSLYVVASPAPTMTTSFSIFSLRMNVLEAENSRGFSSQKNFSIRQDESGTIQVPILEEGKSLTPGVLYYVSLFVNCDTFAPSSSSQIGPYDFTIEYRP